MYFISKWLDHHKQRLRVKKGFDLIYAGVVGRKMIIIDNYFIFRKVIYIVNCFIVKFSYIPIFPPK